MGMRQRRTVEERRRFWAELSRSGDPVRVVARRIGVPAATAYVWKKAGPMPESPVFAQLLPARLATSPVLKVPAGQATILVERDFDPELLRAVVGALGTES